MATNAANSGSGFCTGGAAELCFVISLLPFECCVPTGPALLPRETDRSLQTSGRYLSIRHGNKAHPAARESPSKRRTLVSAQLVAAGRLSCQTTYPTHARRRDAG